MATTFATNDLGTIAYGGESNDKATETLDSLVATVSVTPSATFSQTGTKSLAFDLTTNGNKAVVRADDGTSRLTIGMLVLSFAAGLSAIPTAEACIFGGDAGTAGPNAGTALTSRYVRIGTDRKVYLYDKSGSVIVGGTSTSTIPTSGAMKEVTISFDGLTNPANTWIKVYFDGVEELAFASGQPIQNIFRTADLCGFWGDSCPTGTNRGCILYLDDFIARYSATQSEAPHLTQYPRIRVAGSVTADSQATYNAWGPTPAGADHYNRITTNDGDTTTLADAHASFQDSWKSSTANPMPGGSIVVKAQLRQVAKLGTGAGKTAPDVMWGTVGTEGILTPAMIGSMTTSYTARICARLLQPTTDFPVYADANANAAAWGISSAGAIPNATITFAPGPEWVYYTALLPLGTAPSSGAVVDTSTVGTYADAQVV